MHWWDDTFSEAESATKEAQADLIRREGLTIENAHLPAERANALWMDTLDGQAALEGYLADLEGLAACEIPVAVMHLSNGRTPPPVSAVGIRRIRALAERAEQRGVRLALENVRFPSIVAYTLDWIDSPMLGLCYDAGHDRVWSPVPCALLARYPDRLFAVHLHDNHGENDDHLAPGMGCVDWQVVRAGIEQSCYKGAYTLEGDSAVIPASRSPQEHLRMLYAGAADMLLRG